MSDQAGQAGRSPIGSERCLPAKLPQLNQLELDKRKQVTQYMEFTSPSAYTSYDNTYKVPTTYLAHMSRGVGESE